MADVCRGRADLHFVATSIDYVVLRCGVIATQVLGRVDHELDRPRFACRERHARDPTQILARIIRDLTGGPEQSLAFAWRELFNPLGIRHVTLEFDGAGTLQGANYMLASARDWAKLGVLYANDGVVGGKKLLHPDWVDFCAAATLGTDYAAGFYTNRSDHPDAKGRVQSGMPRDSFLASGILGQRLVIVPSQKLVVVRLGDTVEPTGDIAGVARLVKEVIAAVGH